MILVTITRHRHGPDYDEQGMTTMHDTAFVSVAVNELRNIILEEKTVDAALGFGPVGS